MAQVVWTEKSVGNLESIHAFIALDSVVYADRFIKDLIKRAQILETFPSSGRVVPEFKFDWLREMIHDNYRIVYSTKKIATDIVEIIAVTRSSQLIEKLIDPYNK